MGWSNDPGQRTILAELPLFANPYTTAQNSLSKKNDKLQTNEISSDDFNLTIRKKKFRAQGTSPHYELSYVCIV